MMRKRITLLAGVIAALVLGGAVAYASIPGPDGVIHGCRKNTDGSLRAIDSAATCPTGYTALNWSQTGPAGPAGPVGPQGPSGFTGYEVVDHQQGFSLGSDGLFELGASCPTVGTVRKVALGGGGSDGISTTVVTRNSFPTEFNASGYAQGWRVQWKETDPGVTAATADVWAICAFPPS